MTSHRRVTIVLTHIPLTLDPSSWYFPRVALVVSALIVLFAVAFYTSLAGKRWFPRVAM